jgi:hypothetical protein
LEGHEDGCDAAVKVEDSVVLQIEEHKVFKVVQRLGIN